MVETTTKTCRVVSITFFVTIQQTTTPSSSSLRNCSTVLSSVSTIWRYRRHVGTSLVGPYLRVVGDYNTFVLPSPSLVATSYFLLLVKPVGATDHNHFFKAVEDIHEVFLHFVIKLAASASSSSDRRSPTVHDHHVDADADATYTSRGMDDSRTRALASCRLIRSIVVEGVARMASRIPPGQVL